MYSSYSRAYSNSEQSERTKSQISDFWRNERTHEITQRFEDFSESFSAQLRTKTIIIIYYFFVLFALSRRTHEILNIRTSHTHAGTHSSAL